MIIMNLNTIKKLLIQGIVVVLMISGTMETGIR